MRNSTHFKINASIGLWYEDAVNAHETRVISDGGSLHDRDQLLLDLQALGESEFNNSISLYLPTAGNKSGKIYDVKGSNDLDYIGPSGSTLFNETGDLEAAPSDIPRIDYSIGNPAFLIETQRTNNELYSYNIPASSAWNEGNGIVSTLNQVGITGEVNQGLLLEDNTTTNFSQLARNESFLDANIYKVSVWIKKDNDETRFPEIIVKFIKTSDSLPVESIIQLNTKTGATVARNGKQDNLLYVLDRKDWWEIVCISPEAVSTFKPMYIRPAMTTTLGSFSSTPTGSIITGHVGLYQSDVIDETPIVTNNGTVTIQETLATTSNLSGVTTIEEKVDGTINTITTIPGTYQMSFGSVEYVIFK